MNLRDTFKRWEAWIALAAVISSILTLTFGIAGIVTVPVWALITAAIIVVTALLALASIFSGIHK